MERRKQDEIWQEAYENGWDNGFKACLIHLRETLIDELIKQNKLIEKKDKKFIRL